MTLYQNTSGVWVPVLTNLTASGQTFTPADLAALNVTQAGQYEIVTVVTNDFGSTVVTVPINVYGPPQVRGLPNDTSIVEGQTFTVPSGTVLSSTPTTTEVCAHHRSLNSYTSPFVCVCGGVLRTGLLVSHRDPMHGLGISAGYHNRSCATPPPPPPS